MLSESVDYLNCFFFFFIEMCFKINYKIVLHYIPVALEETGGTLRNLFFIQKVMTNFVLRFDYKLAEIVNMLRIWRIL